MVFEVKKYQWCDGFTPKTSAEVVGKVLEEIEEKDGQVTKEAFLDASRPKNSPTHSMFEWNDKVAAEKYRLQTAQKYILNLRIIHEETPETKIVTPAFINVEERGTSATYTNIVTALSEQETKELIIARLKREVEALIERNKHIEELADILSEALEELQKVG